MKVTYKGDYALKAILDLAMAPAGEAVKVADMAAREDIPAKFLEGILGSLRRGGFVKSKRGPDGGYTLARPASEISVGEVLRYIEGSLLPIGCLDADKSTCDFVGVCGFLEMWRHVDEVVREIIDNTTFEDIRRNAEKKRATAARNWTI